MMKNFILFILVLHINCNLIFCQEFDKSHVGVSFSPYVKLWEGDSTPPWNSYNVYDIKFMLRLAASKFQNIATYSIGVTNESLNKTFDKGDANGLIPRAASELNEEQNELLISIAQGIHQSSNEAIFAREIEAAFEAAEEANKKFPGTVWALILTNQYITDNERGEQIVHLISRNKDKAKTLGLKLGVRTNTCGDLMNHGEAKVSLEKLATISDFIMCNVHPPVSTARQGVNKSIEAIGKEFLQLQSAFKSINPKLEVILGDTGWPSKGKSFNGSPNNIVNLKAFWVGVNFWASQHHVRIYLFEAFDEPWKTDIRDTDPDKPNGRYGAESHFGWWKRLDNYNNRPNTYVEKVFVEGVEDRVDTSSNSNVLFVSANYFYILIFQVIFTFYRCY